MRIKFDSSQLSRRAGLILACSILAGIAIAQEKEPDSARQLRGGVNSVIVASKEDYTIGVSDIIAVTIDKAPELSGNWRVSARGTIRMPPPLGDIAASGKSPDTLGSFIADKLRGRYLREPIVSVEVKLCYSRAFFVQGSVRSPGVYYIEGRIKLFQLITIAGGLDKDHGSTAYVIRKREGRTTNAPGEQTATSMASPGTGEQGTGSQRSVQPEAPGAPPADDDDEYEAIAVNISSLMTGHFERDMIIEPGDVVHIPPTDIFFVGGEVKAPGQFALRPGTTFRQAIALAQGVTFNAAGKATVFRENATSGQNEEVRVDIGAVMNGKAQDITIRANDVIIVPNSRMKTVGGGLLKAFGLSFASVRYY
jgi:polysaccharide export outer membrane protein